MEFNDDEFICEQYAENHSEYFNAIAPPIIMTSLHIFETIEEYYSVNRQERFVYNRVSNPTVDILEKKIAALEHADGAKCFATGMAAISSAILSTVKNGSHIICVKNVYGPVRNFIDNYLNKFNINCTYVKGDSIKEFEEAIQQNTSLIYLESPSSIVFSIQNLKEISKVAKKHGIKTVIDNTYSTPIGQRPLELGIDISVHSMTKYFGGHGDLVGGVLVANSQIIKNIMFTERELFGGTIGPMEAWLVIRGLRTLPIRLKSHSENGFKIAKFLENHPATEKVYYPFLDSNSENQLAKSQMRYAGGLMSFELKADVEKSKEFVNKLKLFKIGVSWGGYESLVFMPTLKTSASELEFLGCSNKIIRIFVGLDNVDMLIEDLNRALNDI